MADSPTITHETDGAFTIIEVVERNTSGSDYTKIPKESYPLPTSGTIVRIDIFLESGSATTLDPALYYADPSTAPNPDSVKIAGGIAGGPTVYSDTTLIPYGRPHWDGEIWIASNPDAGSDNFVRTRLIIRGE